MPLSEREYMHEDRPGEDEPTRRIPRARFARPVGRRLNWRRLALALVMAIVLMVGGVAIDVAAAVWAALLLAALLMALAMVIAWWLTGSGW